ncbi:hypothetical protein ACFQU2_02950 [Siccirubricoccus deserti]
MDRFFHLTERRTNLRTEGLAGVTTFLTMVYVVIINPAVLAQAGSTRVPPSSPPAWPPPSARR